ncbi:MAG: signal recognition particle protein [Eubacteriales bacterium]|nr:signal recognition particle protein [Eubacteriales bacterium]
MAFEGLSEKLQKVIKDLTGRGRLSESDVKLAMREVRMALLEADVNFTVVRSLVKKITERACGQDILDSLTPGQQVVKIVNEELIELMGSTHSTLQYSPRTPSVIMLCGLQGAGKTTIAGKLALYLKKRHNKRPLLAACDVYRPAAIEQLKVVGERVGVPVFEQGQGDPVAIARAAVAYGAAHSNDVLVIDTAGRLHIDDALMEELEKIKAATEPAEILLVVDAMTGQDAVNVAESFNNRLDITGVMLTKLDGDTRGGAALSVKAVTGKPIKFSGTGEKPEDFEPFHPERMASRILGMGDVLTLIEKAQANVDEEKAKKLTQKIKEQKFDLEDFAEQFKQMRSMGGVGAMLKMLPGAGQMKVDESQIDEKAILHMEAIISSMTPAERRNPNILNAGRRRRIARGAGVEVQDVNRLIKQFEQTKAMMKQFSGKGMKKFSRGGRLPF